MSRDTFNDEDLKYCIRLVKNKKYNAFGKDILKKDVSKPLNEISSRYKTKKEKRRLKAIREKSLMAREFIREQKFNKNNMSVDSKMKR